MITPGGLRLAIPSTTIPWTGSADAFADAISGPRTIFGRRRRGAVEVRPPGPSSHSWEITIPTCSLLPGVDGRLAVRSRRQHEKWLVHQVVLYRGLPRRGLTPPSAAEGPVLEALVAALGPPSATIPEAHDDEGMIHLALAEWRTDAAVVRHGIYTEYNARQDWQEEEVRITPVGFA